MKEINNLIYTLEINYINNSNIDTSIFVKIHDTGLAVKSVRIGDVCITEETINGRVLSGRLDNLDDYCGYRYDYKNGENLVNINPQIPINTAISLINMKKMESDFLSAQMVLSLISRNDYRVVTLNKGNLKIIKTMSAKNEQSEHYSLQDSVDLLKLEGEERFVEQNKQRVYKIDNKSVVVENQTLADGNIKLQLNELSNILSQNPRNYKELIQLKNQIQKNIIANLSEQEKTL